MPPVSDKEKNQKMQEKYQAILTAMLRDDDNKYCVDCDAKGPRWASWNLGIFLCIRCAGIHRNLGVHISRVKSVNLDQWTAEQIASMQAMGNSKARAVYEANIPDNYRRPQNDQALEQFIRGKYEQRKWIAKEWIPPNITISPDITDEEPVKEKSKTSLPKPEKKTTRTSSQNNNSINNNSNASSNSNSNSNNNNVSQPDVVNSNIAKPVKVNNEIEKKPEPEPAIIDLLGDPLTETISKQVEINSSYVTAFDGLTFDQTPPPTTTTVNASNQAAQSNIFLNTNTAISSSGLDGLSFEDTKPANSNNNNKAPLDKNSILALYNTPMSNTNTQNSLQQPQQQQQQLPLNMQNNMFYPQPNTMPFGGVGMNTPQMPQPYGYNPQMYNRMQTPQMSMPYNQPQNQLNNLQFQMNNLNLNLTSTANAFNNANMINNWPTQPQQQQQFMTSNNTNNNKTFNFNANNVSTNSNGNTMASNLWQ